MSDLGSLCAAGATTITTPQGFVVSCVEHNDYIKFFRFINTFNFGDSISWLLYPVSNIVTGWLGSFFTGGLNCTNTVSGGGYCSYAYIQFYETVLLLLVWLFWFGSFLAWMVFGTSVKWFIDISGLTPELIVAIDDANDSLGSSI